MAQLDIAPRPSQKQEIDLTRAETSSQGGLREEMQAALAPGGSSKNAERLEALEKGLSKQQIDKLVPSGNPQLREGLNELASTPTGAKMVGWLASNGWRVGVPPSLSAGGTIDFENKIVLVERNMLQQPKEVLAGVVAHEVFHAMRYAQTGYNRDTWSASFGKQEEFAGLLIQGKVTLEAEGRPVTVDAALNRISEAFQQSYGDVLRQKYSHVPHNPSDTSFSDLERRGLVPKGWSGAIEQRYQEVLSGRR